MQISEHGPARHPINQRLKPGKVSVAAQAAVKWLRPAINPIQLERHVGQASALAQLGSLSVRYALGRKDIKRAQKLRYKVFYKHGHAIADAATMFSRRDRDEYDRLCDHLIVVDEGAKPTRRGGQPVVGTYRLLPGDVAKANGGFYSENEFDLVPLLARHPHLKFVELGRSCVLPAYRGKRTVELLWRGVWNHVSRNGYDVMIGCASLEGTSVTRHARALAFLHHHARAPDEWHVSAQPARRVDMNLMPREDIDIKAAMRQLPPLIKGYLRLGAYVGDGAVIDYQFGTIDVMIIMPVAAIGQRYIEHFSSTQRDAA